MVLILQVALGIVLGVLILVFWRQVLALGLVLLVLAVVVVGVAVIVAIVPEGKIRW